MTQYKKYLEDNYTKATIEAYFKGVTIFNNFLDNKKSDRNFYYFEYSKLYIIIQFQCF